MQRRRRDWRPDGLRRRRFAASAARRRARLKAAARIRRLARTEESAAARPPTAPPAPPPASGTGPDADTGPGPAAARDRAPPPVPHGPSPRALVVSMLASAALVVLAAFATAGLGPSRPVRTGGTARSAERHTRARDYVSYVEGGHRDVVRALSGDTAWSSFGDVVARARESVVRVRLVYGRHGSSWSTDHGSGFVLAGGRLVATAAHVIDTLDEREDCELTVALPDGRVMRATPLVRNTRVEIDDENDWAVLELDGRAPGGLRVGSHTSSRVVVMGFPEQIGLTRDGRVVADAIGEGFPLLPTALLGDLSPGVHHEKSDIDVEFGAIPLGGISGGPVIDRGCVVVGIQTRIRRSRGTDGTTRWYAVAHPVNALRAWLRERAPEALAD